MMIKENNHINTICYYVIKIQSKEGFWKSLYHWEKVYYYSNFHMMHGWIIMCYLSIAFFDAVIEERKKDQNKWDATVQHF